MTEDEKVTAALEAIVSPVFLVGGAVRDKLLGREPHDFDFTTPLLPDEVEARAKAAGRHVVTIGKRQGVLTFKVEAEPKRFVQVEVATFRKDGPGRKPVVVFGGVSLEEDLARRDFTIGAMALGHGGEVIDPFGGVADLEAGVVRAVGKAEDRFREDPLRILRLARFVSTLDFVAEAKTEAAAAKLSHHLLTVSRERVRDELEKLLAGTNVRGGLELLARTGALAFALPEVAAMVGFDQRSRFHRHDLFEHTIQVVEGVEAHPDLKLAALLHDIGKVACHQDRGDHFSFIGHELVSARLAGRLLEDLHIAGDRVLRIVALVELHLLESSPLKAADDAAK